MRMPGTAWLAGVLCSVAAVAHAAGPDASPSASASPVTLPAIATAPALKPLDLPDIKASVQIPDGWFMTKQAEDGTFVYQISREKADGDGMPFKAGFTISVTTKIPAKFSLSPSEYAGSLMANAQDADGKAVPVAKSQDGDAKVYRSEYDSQTDTGKSHAVTIARANDKTGTLYIIFWQSPVSDAATLDPVRDKILSTAKFDPSF